MSRLRKSSSLSNLVASININEVDDEYNENKEQQQQQQQRQRGGGGGGDIKNKTDNNNKTYDDDDDSLSQDKIFKPQLKRVASMIDTNKMNNRELMKAIDENYGDDDEKKLGRNLYNPVNRLLTKTVIRSHMSMLDLETAATTTTSNDAKSTTKDAAAAEHSMMQALRISSTKKKENENDDDVASRIISDANLVSAAGLSGDYKEAEYEDTLRDIIVNKHADWPKDFQILRELGKGLCGTVYLARLNDTKQLVAFKVMQKSKLAQIGEEKHASSERLSHLEVSNGPFISNLFHSYSDPHAYYLLTEYAPCGDLFQCLVYHGLPSLQDAKVYISQISAAIAYLHVKQYVYRDLKPENILLRANGDACLGDFGMAKQLFNVDDRAYSFCGTSQYMSPEVLARKGCRFEADLWSLGILIYELCSGATPYANVHGNQELYEAVVNDSENGGVWCPEWFDDDTIDIVHRLLKCSELDRLGAGGSDSMEKYFQHAWFQSCDVKDVLKGTIKSSLRPRKRNIVYDLRLGAQLNQGNVPWWQD